MLDLRPLSLKLHMSLLSPNMNICQTARTRSRGLTSMDNNINNNNSNLPDEVILEILLRLPVKSLVRFRCVSKSWLSLISDPHFAKSHFELAAAPSHRLIYLAASGSDALSIDIDKSLHDDSASVKLNYPLPTSYVGCYFNIRGSCRGFILLEYYPHLFLWNPSTGLCKRLSYSAIASNFNSFIFLNGFGYDASTDDYLVVIAWYEPSADNMATQLEFFSLRTNSWNKIEGTHFPYMNAGDESRAGTLFNGALHWLAFRYDSEVNVIVAFDLIERNSSEIPLPDDLVMEFDFCDLGVMGGCLSICYMGDGETEIWVMKEYKVLSSWTKSFVVSHDGIPNNFFSLFCYTKGGELVGSDGSVGLLKLNDKGELLEHRAYCDDRHRCKAAMYIESLLPLPSNCGEAREDEQQ